MLVAGVAAEGSGHDGLVAANAAKNAAENNRNFNKKEKERIDTLYGEDEEGKLQAIAAMCARTKCYAQFPEDSEAYQSLLHFAGWGKTLPQYNDAALLEDGLFQYDFVDAGKDFWVRQDNTYQLVTRGIGLVQGVGGTVELVAGIGVGTTCATGIGCAAGAALVFNGADNATTGFDQLIWGQPKNTLLNLALQDLGLSAGAATWLEAAFGIGAGGVATAAKALPKATSLINKTPETPTVNWGAITDAEASGYSFYDKFKTVDGANWNWPADLGFEGSIVHEVLPIGTLLDRYGDIKGSFMSPYGLPYESRALAPGSRASGYHVYEVIAPLPVKSGKIAPAFDQPGGGIQILPDFPTKVNVEWLIDKYLKKVD
jgi:filamentous hemagglutinin